MIVILKTMLRQANLYKHWQLLINCKKTTKAPAGFGRGFIMEIRQNQPVYSIGFDLLSTDRRCFVGILSGSLYLVFIPK